MNLKQTIRKVLREEGTRADLLRDQSKKHGLDMINKMMGIDNYIKLAYDGDVKEFYKNENVEPYRIKEGDEVNMYIDNTLVNYLNLEDFRDGEKKLGEFRFGKKNGTKFKFDARLIRVTRMGETIGWKVVGMSGSHGFGYSFINASDILGKTYKKQIFQQIIDKYNLNDYK